LAAFASASSGEPPPANPPGAARSDAAARVFDSFRALEGEWLAESTAGWAGEATFETVGSGSAVVVRSRVAPHGEQIMLTVVHPDRGRLLLTHYCVAGNQPRLVAEEWSEDGRSVSFRFLDGTNMLSRDEGHMDAAEYRFVDQDHFTSRWSWSQEGREKWFEEIHYRRRR